MTKKLAIIIMRLHKNKMTAILIKMMALFIPAKLVVKMVEFVLGMPLEMKDRVVAEIKNQQEWVCHRYPSFIYDDPHYTKTDEKQSPYEDYFMFHEIEADRPHNQLYLYKRYSRQLEHKIKQLEEQLKDVFWNWKEE